MQPKISQGNDDNRVMAEAKALIENGWILDDEAMGVKKTFHFKTYTKSLVREGLHLEPVRAGADIPPRRTFFTP